MESFRDALDRLTQTFVSELLETVRAAAVEQLAEQEKRETRPKPTRILRTNHVAPGAAEAAPVVVGGARGVGQAPLQGLEEIDDLRGWLLGRHRDFLTGDLLLNRRLHTLDVFVLVLLRIEVTTRQLRDELVGELGLDGLERDGRS